MSFFSQYIIEEISTGIVIASAILLRIISARLVQRYAKLNATIEHRTNLVIKYFHILINIMTVFTLIVVWGVDKKEILFFLSSITTVIGAAMFAQWSILSNISSGIILFFFFPFNIGDVIHIHDKESPIEGEIVDIKTFYVYLKTNSGEFITYPNNMLLQKGISVIKQQIKNSEFTD